MKVCELVKLLNKLNPDDELTIYEDAFDIFRKKDWIGYINFDTDAGRINWYNPGEPEREG